MLVVTTNTIDGGRITRYIDAVCASTVVGTNVFSDFAASFTDFFGGRSGTYKRKLEAIHEEARKELEGKASRMGANAIVGYRVDFDEISGKDKSMLMVSVSGTACVVDYDSKGGASRIEQVGRFAVEEELEKMRAVDRLKAGRLLQDDDLQLLSRLRPKEAVRPLVGLYLQYGKDPSDKTAQEAAGVLSAYPFEEAGEELYAAYEESGHSPLVCGLISGCGFFDARSVLEVCRRDVHAGIRLLDAGRSSYDREELGRMKEICAFLDSLPDTGRIEKVKAGLLKKEEEMFVCQNGHKSKRDSEFCENASCCVNIKGLTPKEVETVERFKKRVEVIGRMLEG